MATVCGIFVAHNFYCKFCDYLAPKKYNFDKHLLTPKKTKEPKIPFGRFNQKLVWANLTVWATWVLKIYLTSLLLLSFSSFYCNFIGV